jgi:hypothetical protein
MRQFAKVALAVYTALFVLRFSYFWLDDVVRDESGTLAQRLIEEGTGAAAAFTLGCVVFLLWRRAPLRGPGGSRRLPMYALVGLGYTVLGTSLMWGSREVLFRAFGLGDYDYGRMPLRYAMEAPEAIVGFATLLAVLALVDEARSRRVHELAAANLEKALAQSQLHNLRLQLQPHFLFNALNTISARVHDDPALADAMLGKLADLLRASLRASEVHEVPLREELALLRAYTDLMQARFGSNLVIRIDADAHAESALVPPLVLQPLVENAVRHGRLNRDGSARIDISVRATPAELALGVHDDGPGVTNGVDPLAAGTGLAVTARRLALLHGDNARVTARNAASGGFEVRIVMPRRDG